MVYDEIIHGTGVYWSNFFPSYIFPMIPGASESDIYYSRPVVSIPTGKYFK